MISRDNFFRFLLANRCFLGEKDTSECEYFPIPFINCYGIFQPIYLIAEHLAQWIATCKLQNGKIRYRGKAKKEEPKMIFIKLSET
ncbi:MAG: hypothetical protein AB1489_40445, partial [Acidobacteriota bacterium]